MSHTASSHQDQLLHEIRYRLANQQYDVAQLRCTQLIAQFPACFDAHVIMSKLLYRAGRIRLSTKYALSARDAINDDVPLSHRVELCTHFLLLGEEEAAYELIKSVSSQLMPGDSSVFEVALHLNALGREHEALSCLRQIVGGNTSNPAINQITGTLLANMGNKQGAGECLENVVSAQPLNGQVQWTLAFLNLAEGGEERIRRMVKAINSPDIESVQMQLFHYALFREYDRIGETENAWRHLEQASRLRRKDVSHSSATETSNIDALIRGSEDGLTPGDEHPGVGGHTPIFILGMPRTGTSLLERLLGSFRQVQPCGELTTFRTQLIWQLDQKMEDPFDAVLAEKISDIDFRKLGQAYQEKTGWRRNGADFFIDKQPFNYNFAGLIAKAIPEAKIIHLMRNPMDTCFSNLKEGFAPGRADYSYTQEELATHYLNYRRLMRHWDEIAPGRILHVHYEKLVTQYKKESERVRLFCGIAEQRSETDARDQCEPYVTSTLSAIQLLEPIHARNINSWHRYEHKLQVLKESLWKEQQEYEALVLTK